MKANISWALGCCFLALLSSGQGGGGPLNALLVVNDNSAFSLNAGKYYQQQRLIPEQNVFHIQCPTNNGMDVAEFTNAVWNPIVAYLRESGLSNQIDYLVFAPGIPHRIYANADGLWTNMNSLPGAMFYGYKQSPPGVCSLPSDTFSAYYQSERAFSHAGAPSSNRYYLTQVLAASDWASFTQLVDRSIVADNRTPTGTAYLVHSSDTARNIQWRRYDDTAFLRRFLSGTTETAIDDSGFLQGKTNIMGYMIGAQWVSYLTQNVFIPGALGDHVTSFGGRLYEPIGHMPVTDWLKAGCVASYGTVVEPCNYTNKFPDPRVHFWYGRGFNAGESYWMSVQNPYQGLFVGDPLAQPFAVPPSLAIGGVSSGQTVSGVCTLLCAIVSTVNSRPIDGADLFINDRFSVALTNLPPELSNIVTITINGTPRSYSVETGDSIHDIAKGLAVAINKPPPLGFTATAQGDRVEIRQNMLGVSATSLTCQADSTTGGLERLTVFAYMPRTNFLETIYPAKEQVTLKGTCVSGDVVRAVVTTLSGLVVTNEAVATSTNDTAYGLLTNLAHRVNTHPDLMEASGCEVKWIGYNYFIPSYEGYFISRTNTWAGHNLWIDYSVITNAGSMLVGPAFSDNFNDNSEALSARAQVWISSGTTQLTLLHELDTTTWPDGPHRISVVAYEGTAVRTQGRMDVPIEIDNHTMLCAWTNLDPVIYLISGRSITARVEAVAEPGAVVTGVLFLVEGKPYAATNMSSWEFVFTSTGYGLGETKIQAWAFADDGRSVLSTPVSLQLAEPHTIISSSSPNGVLIPSGIVEVAHGGSATFEAIPDEFYHVTNLVADGLPLGATNGYAFMSVTGDHSLVAYFSANLAAYSVPEWWLDSFYPGMTNFDELAASDTDMDGYWAWEEFVGDTVPTQYASHFPPVTNFFGTGTARVEIALTSTNRQYDVFWAVDVLDNPQIWTPGGLNVAGTGSNLLLQITNIAPVRFYRTGAFVP